MAFNGILLVDKSESVTSHDVVDSLRRILKQKDVGHAGTLDPLATGLLVCLVGEATKLSQFVVSDDKAYEVEIKLGVKTDSGDITGQVIQEKDAQHITKELIQARLPELLGDLMLQVPIYSAIKIAGKKLYEYARDQKEVVLPLKLMVIKSAMITSFKPGYCTIELSCGKGTYVRSWAEKLGELLGVGATVSKLRRTRSGGFNIEQSQTVTKFSENETLAAEKLIPLADALSDWPVLRLIGRDVDLVKNGQIPRGIFGQLVDYPIKDGVKLINEQGSLLAVVVKDAKKGVKLGRVFETPA
ncbi:MAG: tRNA pseudouridine(55) synthase TruB [Oligoflexia bacterium]|nr:tRNA pseudouridine(55) synthase TruB [Oligoflexia bacterium]